MIQERIMALGSWDVTLARDTPVTLLDKIKLATAAFSRLVVTPTWDPTNSYSAANLLTMSRYTGVYMAARNRRELSGVGSSQWIGDAQGKGSFSGYSSSPNTTWNKTAATFATWIAALHPPALTSGTVTDPTAGTTITQNLAHSTRKDALQWILDFYGAEYRVKHSLTVDYGTATALYGATPTTAVMRRAGSHEPGSGIDSFHAATFDVARDMYDYNTRAVMEQSASVAVSDISSVPYKDPQGNAVVVARYLSRTDLTGTAQTANTTTIANRYGAERIELRISTEEYDVAGILTCGENIYAYDPEYGITDSTNTLTFQGETIQPKIYRLVGVQWPVEAGMGVYLISSVDNATVIDLTSYVAFEQGAATIDVGDALRPLSRTIYHKNTTT